MKLTDVCDFQGGSQPPKSQWSDEPKEGYIRVLQIRDFTQDNSKVEYVKITNSTKKCEEKDILIARYGASIGKILTGLSGAYNVAMMKVIIDENIVDRKFIYYFLKSDVFQNYIRNVGQRAAQAGFNKGELSKININLPTLKEQKNVAKELDKVQEMIDIREKQIEQLDELIKSQFVEMFGSVELNDKKFEEQEMSCIADISSSKRIYANEYQEIGIPFYRSKEIIELGHNKKPSIELFISKSRYEEIKDKYGIPKKGDILITAVGTIGETWIVDTDEPFYYKDGNVLQIRLNTDISQIYFKYVLDTLISIFKNKNVSGSAYSALTIEKFKKMKIILPPIELQDKFAEIVKQIDKQKFEIQKNLEEMQNLQESLMNKYF